MERCKTNSATHLIKILIAEELHKTIPKIEERIAKLEKVEGELENAGLPWALFEEQQLYQELDEFINNTARKHKRSLGAIRARVKMVVHF